MTLVDQMGRTISSGKGQSGGQGGQSGQGAGGQRQSQSQAAIVDVDATNFMAEAVEASMQQPVIVDFWAPWCQPCKQLTPMLERAVQASGGRVKLCKLNVDENKEIAQQLRIQSLPTVYAFLQGQPVDGFVGQQQESEVKALVERLVQMADQAGLKGGGQGPSLDEVLDQARQTYQQGDYRAAGELYARVLQQYDSQNLDALTGMAHCQLALNDKKTAREIFDQIPKELAHKTPVEGLRAALELAEAGGTPARKLQKRLEKDADDHQARFDLAMTLYNAGDKERAISELLEIVRRDRSWEDDAARKQLVKLFEALGPTDPAVVRGRRELSRLMFA